MSVCAFDFDDIRKEDPFRDLGSNVNPITWPSVHVGHCVLSWNKYLIVFGGFTTIFSRNAGFEGVDDVSNFFSAFPRFIDSIFPQYSAYSKHDFNEF